MAVWFAAGDFEIYYAMVDGSTGRLHARETYRGLPKSLGRRRVHGLSTTIWWNRPTVLNHVRSCTLTLFTSPRFVCIRHPLARTYFSSFKTPHPDPPFLLNPPSPLAPHTPCTMIAMLKDIVNKQIAELKKLWDNKAELLFQLLNLAMIVFSALMIWKGLMFLTKSESPVVVGESRSSGSGICC